MTDRVAPIEYFRERVCSDMMSVYPMPAQLAAKEESFREFARNVKDPYEICEKYPAFKAEMEALMAGLDFPHRRVIEQTLWLFDMQAKKYREVLGRDTFQARQTKLAEMNVRRDRRLEMVAEIQNHVQQTLGYKSFMVTLNADRINTWFLQVWVPGIERDEYYALHNSVKEHLNNKYQVAPDAISVAPHDSEGTLFAE